MFGIRGLGWGRVVGKGVGKGRWGRGLGKMVGVGVRVDEGEWGCLCGGVRRSMKG